MTPPSPADLRRLVPFDGHLGSSLGCPYRVDGRLTLYPILGFSLFSFALARSERLLFFSFALARRREVVVIIPSPDDPPQPADLRRLVPYDGCLGSSLGCPYRVDGRLALYPILGFSLFSFVLARKREAIILF